MTAKPRFFTFVEDAKGRALCANGHLPLVTYRRRARDLFRKRYFVVCWHCSLHDGPWHDLRAARLRCEDIYDQGTDPALRA